MTCIGPETARRLAGRFEMRALGPQQLKNVRGEVMVHEVIARR